MEGARVGDRRPGGRSARVREAILISTMEALAETSYESLRIEDVAERAGVNKTTIYRRWPTKAELVAEATRVRSATAVPLPDTGSLAGDLRALARSVAANIGSADGTHVARTMVAAAVTSDEVAARAPEFWADRIRLATRIVDAAIARGEVAPGVDANLVIETLIGPLYVRVLLTGEPVTRRFADEAAALVHAGVRGSAGSSGAG
jgi:AcrR family transcriptional regulator